MKNLDIFICGSNDVVSHFDKLTMSITKINATTSKTTDVLLQPHYWTVKTTGPDAQRNFEQQLSKCDMVLFILYRRLGPVTEEEFKHSLFAFRERGSPEIRVWYEYVPSEFESDMGDEYARLLKFKEYVERDIPEVFACPTFRSERETALMFGDNAKLPGLDAICLHELHTYVLEKSNSRDAVVADQMRSTLPEAVTRDMRVDHWQRRAARDGLFTVTSERYAERASELNAESRRFVDFVLKYGEPYLRDRKVIEFGSGIGRFTLPMLDMVKSLTTLDMCPDMKEKLMARLGKRCDEVRYINSFLEEFDSHGEIWDTSLVCLVMIHILNKQDLQRAVRNIKLCSETVILCEHTDTAAQGDSSNFTHIWSRGDLIELFEPDYTIEISQEYSFLGDKLDLLVFRRSRSFNRETYAKYLDGQRADVLKKAPDRSKVEIPMPWDDWYSTFVLGGLRFAYEPLIGSETPKEWVFGPRDVSIVRNEEKVWAPPEEFADEWEERRIREKQRVYNKGDYLPRSEKKVRIDAILPRGVNSHSGVPSSIKLHISKLDYYDYIITNELLNDRSLDFRATHTTRLHLAPETIGELRTTNIGGCGVFVRTQDGFLVLSFRRMVEQHPHLVSYSASGSMNWWLPSNVETLEANPFLSAMRETHEELGISLHSDDLRLFAVGIDLTGMFIQFSFVVDVQFSAREVLGAWKEATARYEQYPFAVEWKLQEIVHIVSRYAMEPSAAASLLQLAYQDFGKHAVEECVRKALQASG